MEIILTGILLAIGFYLAPIVLTLVAVLIGSIFEGLAFLFGGKK